MHRIKARVQVREKREKGENERVSERKREPDADMKQDLGTIHQFFNSFYIYKYSAFTD